MLQGDLCLSHIWAFEDPTFYFHFIHRAFHRGKYFFFCFSLNTECISKLNKCECAKNFFLPTTADFEVIVQGMSNKLRAEL